MDGATNDNKSSMVNTTNLTEHVCGNISQCIVPNIIEKLYPEIRDAIILEVVPALKKDLVDTMKELLLNIKADIKDVVYKTQFSSHDAKQFMNDNAQTFNSCEKDRDDAYYKGTRCKELIELYEHGLNSDLIYVPKKYRHDKYHIKSHQELEVLKNRERNELNAEIEILKLRKKENTKKVALQDQLINTFVHKKVENPYVRKEILKLWTENNQKEEDRINKKWKKKIDGMKSAFTKDKEFIEKYNRTRYVQLSGLENVSSSDYNISNENITPIILESDQIQTEIINTNVTEEQLEVLNENNIEETRFRDLDSISSQENFTDLDESRVLFQSPNDNEMIGMLAQNFESSSDDEETEENTENNTVFRNSYNLRNRPNNKKSNATQRGDRLSAPLQQNSTISNPLTRPQIQSTRRRQSAPKYSIYQNRDLRSSRYGY